MAGLVSLWIQSCDDYLDLNPASNGVVVRNAESDTLVYKTAGEAEGALAGVYSDFYNEYFQLDWFLNGDAQSDNAYAGADNPSIFQIDDFKIDATNSNVSRDWAYLYSTIGKANLVIAHVNRVPDPSLTAQRKAEIIAEASFIRAFMYFQLVQLFGDVPLQTEPITSISGDRLDEILPVIFPPRADMSDVYALIIEDLETALASVPLTAKDKGFATRGAVNALLAKVYATMEPHNWEKVNEYCDAVIALGYELVPDYETLWNNTQENTVESIFEINCYGWDAGSGNWGASMFYGSDWKKFNIPSNDLVRAFDEEGDMIRKNSSITFMDVTGAWTDRHWPSNNYPFVYKYRDLSGAQNFILLRLADILLLKAEALNEMGDAEGAAELVNEVRARVDLDPTPATNQADMRLAIEKERRLELAFEGHRWFDLKRTGRAIEVMNVVTDGAGNSLGYQLTEQKLLWPVPQEERDKNTQLTQNAGY